MIAWFFGWPAAIVGTLCLAAIAHYINGDSHE